MFPGPGNRDTATPCTATCHTQHNDACKQCRATNNCKVSGILLGSDHIVPM